MNVRTLRALAALLVAITSGACHRRADVPPPLAGAAIGGPLAGLVDQDGRPVDKTRFAGRYRAIYFGYSFCPDICPTTLATLMQGYRAFAAKDPAAAAKLVPIFVTVDPDRDTAPVMKQYVAAFGPQLVGLTGTPALIAAVAKGYAVYYRKQPAAAGASGYLVDHSSQPMLFGPGGDPIALIPADQGADAVAQTFGEWVR